jgi:uncharacterized protein (TIGR03083 family)
MEIAEYLDQLEHAGDELGRAARYAGVTALVPSCPGWTVADLLRHTTNVHHRVIHLVGGGDRREFSMDVPDDDAVTGVYEDGMIGVLAKLRTAPKNLDVWTFSPTESPLTFWSRRQAHETSIHRVDADLAADLGVQEFDAGFAADGIGELLTQFAPGAFSRVDVTRPLKITLATVDVNRAWTVLVSPESVTTTEDAVDGDLTVLGTASDLYRWVWNRAGDDEVSLSGDVTLTDLWHTSFVIGAGGRASN